MTLLADAPAAKNRKADVTRGTILTAAARMFAEKGYTECSLRDIASVAGMKAGSVYYHFPSKEELLDEVLRVGLERLGAKVQAALDSLGPNASAADRYRGAIRTHVTSFLDVTGDANTFLRIYEHLPPKMKRRGRDYRTAYADLWRRLFDDGVKSGEFSPTIDRALFVPFFLQAMNRIIEWFSPSRMTIDSVCQMIDDSVLNGVLVKRR